MKEISVFNKSIKGASHNNSGKPCQDYSISLNENGVQILVVCDGHGGESYVRSDTGAKLAAEITADTLLGFSNSMGSNPFAESTFSITAKPRKNPFVDSEGNSFRYEDMNDNQKRYAMQAKAYTEASGKFVDKQDIVNELLRQIYMLWTAAISEDRNNKPFTSVELSKLNGKPTEKAYGCTLLAYMQTESYWLSFQIGDGKILFCNKDLAWSSPIQEDCNCFLNYTTSLCDSNPLGEFRYAFSGEGKFPFAVFLCSDGVEGSLRTDANIQDFYEQVIEICADGEDVTAELNDYLPQLSERGNRDDMSISGVVYMNKTNKEDFSKRLDIQRKKRSILNEQNSKKAEISKISSRIDTLEVKLSRYIDSRSTLKDALDSIKHSFQSKEREFTENEDLISSIQSELRSLMDELQSKKKEFEDWDFTIKNELAELEEENDDEKKDEGWMSFIQDTFKQIVNNK